MGIFALKFPPAIRKVQVVLEVSRLRCPMGAGNVGNAIFAHPLAGEVMRYPEMDGRGGIELGYGVSTGAFTNGRNNLRPAARQFQALARAGSEQDAGFEPKS